MLADQNVDTAHSQIYPRTTKTPHHGNMKAAPRKCIYAERLLTNRCKTIFFDTLMLLEHSSSAIIMHFDNLFARDRDMMVRVVLVFMIVLVLGEARRHR